MTQYAIFLHYEDADSEAFGPFNSYDAMHEVFVQLNGVISSDTIIAALPLHTATPEAIRECIAAHPEGSESYDDDEADELQEVEVDDDGKY